MDEDTIALVIKFLELDKVNTLDITGGAPELHPHFRELVTKASRLGVHVIDRCNLTPTFSRTGNKGQQIGRACHRSM